MPEKSPLEEAYKRTPPWDIDGRSRPSSSRRRPALSIGAAGMLDRDGETRHAWLATVERV